MKLIIICYFHNGRTAKPVSRRCSVNSFTGKGNLRKMLQKLCRFFFCNSVSDWWDKEDCENAKTRDRPIWIFYCWLPIFKNQGNQWLIYDFSLLPTDLLSPFSLDILKMKGPHIERVSICTEYYITKVTKKKDITLICGTRINTQLTAKR